VHGDKFKLADSSTWGEPIATLESEDPKWGTVQIQHACWVPLPRRERLISQYCSVKLRSW